jgi:hypothetical protein
MDAVEANVREASEGFCFLNGLTADEAELCNDHRKTKRDMYEEFRERIRADAVAAVAPVKIAR